MIKESVYRLDTQALRLFSHKGAEGGPEVPQGGPANGVKVRRIMQITQDLSLRSFKHLRILDLGCGEGCYAIEAGLRGAQVLALDARRQRMDQGVAVAYRHGLDQVKFIQEDVRHLKRKVHGSFDVVYFLGLMYHLDVPDVFFVLENIFNVCTRLLVIDTLISLTAEHKVEWRSGTYQGKRVREHNDEDPEQVRKSRVLKSIDNTFSFHFTKGSLLQALLEIGFSSVFECHLPLEPGKAENRITLVAIKGKPVLISTYPWVNHKSEAEIEEALLKGDRLSELKDGKIIVNHSGQEGIRPSPYYKFIKKSRSSIVFFCMPENGHFQRLRSLITGLAGRGLDVHVFTHQKFASQVRGAGGIFFDLFSKYPLEAVDRESLPVPCRYVTFAGRYAQQVFSEVEKTKPSLIVHDTFAVIGQVIANLTGIPRVTVCSGHNVTPARFLPILKKDPRVRIADQCLQAVETLRRSYGLADASPFSYISSLSPYLNLYCEPSEFLDKQARPSFEPIAFFGSLPSLERDQFEGPENQIWPEVRSDRTLRVYVSFGTVVWRYYAAQALKALNGLVEGLTDFPYIRTMISLGGVKISPKDLAGLQGPNVRIENYVNQWEVLKSADAFVTHHGMNSTHEAIFHRVPMISYPFFWDQPMLATKCQQLGIAIPLTNVLQGQVGKNQVWVALRRLKEEKGSMEKSLARVYQWEKTVMANRPAVLQRVVDLMK